MLPRKICALAAALAGVTTLSACSGHGNSGAAPQAARLPAVQASRSHCGEGWTSAQAGVIRLNVRNTDVNAAEVYLADTSGKLYGEIDPLGPNATAVLTAQLSAGSYHLRCSVNDGDPVDGPTVKVTGTGRGTQGVEPVSSADLVPAVIGYQKWVRSRLTTLQTQTDALVRRLRAGDRAAAQAAWKTANHTWHTMGAAYGAFGATGDAIDGDAHGLALGVKDPGWTGLLRIEYGLWHGESPSSLGKLGTALRTDLSKLAGQLQTTQFQPLDVVKRAHEISEDTLQQTLTGNHDYGAHVQLDEALAELEGTTQVLSALRPLLAPRYAGLTRVDALITKSTKDIHAQPDWQAPASGRAPSTGHAVVDADIAQLTELLAPVPTRLEPRVA